MKENTTFFGLDIHNKSIEVGRWSRKLGEMIKIGKTSRTSYDVPQAGLPSLLGMISPLLGIPSLRAQKIHGWEEVAVDRKKVLIPD